MTVVLATICAPLLHSRATASEISADLQVSVIVVATCRLSVERERLAPACTAPVAFEAERAPAETVVETGAAAGYTVLTVRF